jgi:bifunctional UDP-N-acetylglucosamine pyrophosphorylase/glucosamine-1-phosphate N-acetyltransferase
MKKSNVCAVVLAAGRGSRMKSDLPKVLHLVNDEPLLVLPLRTLTSIKMSQIVTIVKHQAELVAPIAKPFSDIAYQGEAYGTAKAAEAVLPVLNEDIDTVMIVNGDDSMFYEAKTFKSVLKRHKTDNNTITFITLLKKNPTGFGRVIYDKQGNFQKIVEEKDATISQKKVNEVNDGVYIFDRKFFETFIGQVTPSPVTGEYYLTDLVNMALDNGKKVGTYLLENSLEFYGISTQADVQAANELYSNVKNV